MRDSTFLHLALFWTGVAGFQWTDSVRDGDQITACKTVDQDIPWSYSTDSSEQVVSITWYVHTDLDNKQVATQRHNDFHAMGEYVGRVEFLPPAGLRLKNVEPVLNGRYSVQLSGSSRGGGFLSETKSVDLLVIDPPSTDGDVIQIQQDPTATFNEEDYEYEVQLMCGRFTDLGVPPVSMIWTTSKGDVFNSTKFEDGYFKLAVPNPVHGGNYMCQLSTREPATVCLSPTSKLFLTSSLQLDLAQAYNTLQAPHPQSVEAINNRMKTDIQTLQQKVITDSNTIQALQNEVQALETQLQQKLATCPPSPVSG